MRAKLSGDFADIQVWNRIRPDHIGVVFLVVFGHSLAGMACNGLAIFTGSFVQVQRQRALRESPAFSLLSNPYNSQQVPAPL